MESVYGRVLPASSRIGESWEISDRAGAESVVANGRFAGRTLRELLEEDPRGVMGVAPLRSGRFPLLVKTLDAREVLSLQVHPPADRAASLGGEPKTEMWYITAAEPGSEILVGLRPGTSRDDFARQLAAGTVEHCFHRVPVHAGDAMFLPSGRVHALGAGLLLFEIQESSDTTFRVYDWNRTGLDGTRRPLHVAESMASIDFEDHAPGLVDTPWVSDGKTGTTEVRSLVNDVLFGAEARRGRDGEVWEQGLDRCRIVAVARGALCLGDERDPVRLAAGDFCLLPAGMGSVRGRLVGDTEWVTAAPGPGRN